MPNDTEPHPMTSASEMDIFEMALDDLTIGAYEKGDDRKARAAVLALHAAALAEVERLQAHILERTNFNTRILRERDEALARADAAEKERDAARFDSCFYKAGISAVAIKLRERAAKELHQPRGHDMDAREWACTLLEGAAEDIEVNYPRKPERPAEPPVDDYDERGLPVGWAAEPPVGMREAFEKWYFSRKPDESSSPWDSWQAAIASRPISFTDWGVDQFVDGSVTFTIDNQTFAIQHDKDFDEAKQLHAALSKLAASRPTGEKS